MRNRSAGIAVAATLLLVASPVRAQEWTQFRGPNSTGISSATTVPTAYAPEAANWRVKLPGIGHSSPVIWGNKVFVTSADDTKRHLLCINAADGKTLWDNPYDYSAYRHHQFHNAASGTPAVDAGAVYLTWITEESHTALAVDHSGKELWRRDLGKYLSQHGGSSSPVLVGDLVVIRSDSDDPGPGSFVVALNKKDGAVRWRRPVISKAASYGVPVMYQPKDGPAELVFSSQGQGVVSLDPATGDVNWELNNLFRQRCVSTPTIVDGLVFVTAGNGAGERAGLAVRAGVKGKVQPKVEYQFSRGVPYVPTPVAYNGLIFLWGDAGIVTCIKPADGEVVWSERVGGNFFGSPVCVNGKIYAMSAQGQLIVVEASDQFKLVSTSALGEKSHATPAVSGGVMYLRTEGHLISLGGKKQ
jgi:outer membrane protein assembly factor BamB